LMATRYARIRVLRFDVIDLNILLREDGTQCRDV
jgi:hypothetical protein